MGGTQANSCTIGVQPLGSIPGLLHKYIFIPYWNFEYAKAVLHCCKVGGGMGQGFLTEVTHLELNQPPVFFSVSTFEVAMMLNAQ